MADIQQFGITVQEKSGFVFRIALVKQVDGIVGRLPGILPKERVSRPGQGQSPCNSATKSYASPR